MKYTPRRVYILISDVIKDYLFNNYHIKKYIYHKIGVELKKEKKIIFRNSNNSLFKITKI